MCLVNVCNFAARVTTYSVDTFVGNECVPTVHINVRESLDDTGCGPAIYTAVVC
jgi:hypothetical protein